MFAVVVHDARSCTLVLEKPGVPVIAICSNCFFHLLCTPIVVAFSPQCHTAPPSLLVGARGCVALRAPHRGSAALAYWKLAATLITFGASAWVFPSFRPCARQLSTRPPERSMNENGMAHDELYLRFAAGPHELAQTPDHVCSMQSHDVTGLRCVRRVRRDDGRALTVNVCGHHVLSITADRQNHGTVCGSGHWHCSPARHVHWKTELGASGRIPCYRAV